MIGSFAKKFFKKLRHFLFPDRYIYRRAKTAAYERMFFLPIHHHF